MRGPIVWLKCLLCDFTDPRQLVVTSSILTFAGTSLVAPHNSQAVALCCVTLLSCVLRVPSEIWPFFDSSFCFNYHSHAYMDYIQLTKTLWSGVDHIPICHWAEAHDYLIATMIYAHWKDAEPGADTEGSSEPVSCRVPRSPKLPIVSQFDEQSSSPCKPPNNQPERV